VCAKKKANCQCGARTFNLIHLPPANAFPPPHVLQKQKGKAGDDVEKREGKKK
jgi:hypothetical protein